MNCPSSERSVFQVESEADLGDPRSWRLKGQGKANAVFHYAGDDCIHLRGLVLRAAKRRASPGNQHTPVVCALEELLWPHDGSDYKHLIIQSLASKYILQPLPISVSYLFLDALGDANNTFLLLDQGRVDLFRDATYMYPCTQQGPTYTLELKPKWGFPSVCQTIRPSHQHLKKSISRFALYQPLKKLRGEVDAVSKYDPLKLFSQQKDKVLEALHALFETPHNNLLFFKNGHIIYMDTEEKQVLLPVLHAVLVKEGILEQLLQAQMICQVDIEGLYHIYCHLLSLPLPIGESEIHSHALKELLKLSKEEQLEILRNYMISSTFRDCSIMVTFQAVNAMDYKEDHPFCMAMVNNIWYRYQVFIVDLDKKPLSKIPAHYELDQKLVALAMEGDP